MSSTTKVLKFYKLCMKRFINDEKFVNLDEKEIKSVLAEFISHCKPANSQDPYTIKSTSFEGFDKEIYFDVLKESNEYLFFTIGHEARASFQLRNITSLDAKELQKSKDEILEAYTYILYCYQSGVITYLSDGKSPSIRNLTRLFNIHTLGQRLEKFDNLEINTEVIAHKDILEAAVKKESFYDLTLDVTTPNAEILGSLFPNNEKLYEEIVRDGLSLNVKLVVSKEKVKGKKKGNLGDVLSTSSIKNFISFVKGKPEVNSLKARARNEEERLQDFDFFDSQLTYKIPWTMDTEYFRKQLLNLSESSPEDYERYKLTIQEYIFGLMKGGYESNKGQISTLTRRQTVRS